MSSQKFQVTGNKRVLHAREVTSIKFQVAKEAQRGHVANKIYAA